MRYHPVLGIMKGHSGTDMAADCGTIIHAVASGYVNAVSADVSAGNYVDINHGIVGGNSVITEYLHMQAQYVSPGQYVTRATRWARLARPATRPAATCISVFLRTETMLNRWITCNPGLG